jgi:alpha-1,6-mannosyltransferase
VTLIAWAVPALARAVGRDASGAFALAVLNPLVLLGLLGGSHNDALMLGLLVAGCALARQRHPLMGLALCALGAEVKVPALIGVIFIGWWWSGPEPAVRRRLGRVALAIGSAAGLMVTIGVCAGLGWRWIEGLTNSGAVVSWLDPATGVGLLLAHVSSALGYPGHQSVFVDSARIVALGLAAVISVGLLIRSERHGELQALGWSLVLFVVLGPVVWPWYETWGFVFLAIVAEGWVLAFVFIFSAVACAADVPNPRLLVAADPILVSLCWVCLVASICFFLWSRVASSVSWDGRLGRAAG